MNTVAIKEDFEPDPMNSDIKKTTFNLVIVVLSAGTGWKGHGKRKPKIVFLWSCDGARGSVAERITF